LGNIREWDVSSDFSYREPCINPSRAKCISPSKQGDHLNGGYIETTK